MFRNCYLNPGCVNVKKCKLKNNIEPTYMLLFLFCLFQTYVNLNQYDHSLYANVKDLTAE